jgi:hypothetical protein
MWKIGHLEPGCPNSALALWEQSYLRSIVFGEGDPQSYFTALLDHPDVLEHDNRHPQESTSEDSSSPPEPTLSLAEFTNSFQSLAHSSETSSTSSHSLLLLNNSQHYLYQENHPSPYQQSRKAEVKMAGPARKRHRVNADSTDELPAENRPHKSTGCTRLPSEPSHTIDKPSPAIPRPSRAPKHVKKAMKSLRKIVGRRGQGPIDFARLASNIKANISLLDLFQISPKTTKQFRHFSTIVNEKTRGLPNPTSAAQQLLATIIQQNLTERQSQPTTSTTFEICGDSSNFNDSTDHRKLTRHQLQKTSQKNKETTFEICGDSSNFNGSTDHRKLTRHQLQKTSQKNKETTFEICGDSSNFNGSTDHRKLTRHQLQKTSQKNKETTRGSQSYADKSNREIAEIPAHMNNIGQLSQALTSMSLSSLPTKSLCPAIHPDKRASKIPVVPEQRPKADGKGFLYLRELLMLIKDLT